mmetsp:Transcript_49757/g.128016  ORF Transcript_49757/g.128016 Transcript_49757/m.128016 type:complete len:144 (+) Transcript_49757:187-618(+)
MYSEAKDLANKDFRPFHKALIYGCLAFPLQCAASNEMMTVAYEYMNAINAHVGTAKTLNFVSHIHGGQKMGMHFFHHFLAAHYWKKTAAESEDIYNRLSDYVGESPHENERSWDHKHGFLVSVRKLLDSSLRSSSARRDSRRE